jgi:hypothetical protein
MRAILLSCLAATAAAQSPPIRLVLEHIIDESTGVSFGTIQRLELGVPCRRWP